MADQQPVAVTGSAPGTIDAALDEYLGQKAAPVEDNAPSPSEAPDVNDAAPDAQSPDPEPDTPQAPDPDDDGAADPVQEPVAAAPADQIVTIYPDGPSGAAVETTLDELQNSYMRQADYTRKTTELAQQRQQAEAYYQQVTAKEAQYAQGIDAIAQALQSQEPPDPDPALQEADPVAYLEARDAKREYQERMRGLADERSKVMQHQQVQMTQNMAGQLEQAKNYLVQAMPELQTPDKMKDFIQVNRAHLIANGFSEQEANNVYDPRAAIYIDKARRYDDMMSKASGKRVQANSPTIRQSQTAPTPMNQISGDVTKADKRLSKSGNIDDAVDLILARRRA